MLHPKSFDDFLALVSLRYFIVAGVAYLLFYRIIYKRISHKKIQLPFPGKYDLLREIFHSLCTLFIFAATPSLMLLTSLKSYTQFYSDPLSYGKIYFLLAFPLTFLIHDTYFYFTHRLMHHPRLFKFFHLTHHKSTNPTPWAAFSFSIPEAIVEAGIFVVLLMLLPLCRWHLFIFFALQMMYNVYGHLGWELYPKGFSKHWLGKWVNTSVSHNLHHKYFKGNYGLYFLWWDKMLGTLRTDYDAVYDEVKNRN